MKIRVAPIVLVILALTAAISLTAWDSRRSQFRSAAAGPAVIRVKRDKLVRSLLVSGELAPVRAVRMSVPRFRERSAVPIQAMAPEGSLVKPGDTLLQIDNAPLIASLNNEQINLERADNDAVRKQSELDIQIKDLEMELGIRKLELEKARLKVDISKDLISLRDWQDNQFNFERSLKEFEKTTQKLELMRKAAQEELALTRIKRDQSRSRIEAIQKDLFALQVKAPVAGTVVYETSYNNWNRGENEPARKFQVGDQVFPGQIVISVVDLDEMEVRAYISEVDGGSLRPGQRVRIAVDAYPDLEFTGTVDYIPEVAERLRRFSNVRIFVGRLKLDRTDSKIMKPGMSARIEIVLDEQEGLLLPRSAVFEEKGKTFVQHVTQGLIEVKVVSRNVTACLVEGIREGDEILAKH
jgi:HlyD family secretion protein